MRGNDERQEMVFSYVGMEDRIPAGHPLRRMREMTDAALRELSGEFDQMYARSGRPSIAPEKLLRALTLQVLYSLRSERLLMEQLDYNLLFRWFVGLTMDETVWDVTVFTKNRERLIEGEVAQKFFMVVLGQAREKELLSDEHFTVDGTLIEAWANRRSFKPKQDPPTQGSGSQGRKLLRDTHESSTDAEARLFKRSRGGESKPSYLGHVISENRNGLVVQSCVTQAGTRAEREAALAMLEQVADGRRRITLGADKGYQEEEFVRKLREKKIAPHIAEYEPSKHNPNWLHPEERDDPGYAESLRKRKLVEKIFGWVKSTGGMKKTKLRGVRKVDWMFRLATAVYNLWRMARMPVHIQPT
jgi:transposase